MSHEEHEVRISVLKQKPTLRVVLPGIDGGTFLIVDGMDEAVAFEIPWGPIIDLGLALGKKIFGGDGGGGGGGGGGCITISATNPDGSTFSYKWCPPPHTA